ncbi:MAG: hypothetical protein P8Z36_13915 [Gemmatimonadota bacterium]
MRVPVIDVETPILEWLLDPADPALRTRVLLDLLDRPSDDDEVQHARRRIPDQPWVRATLAAHNGDGTWGRGFYHKYDGTSWVLLHLSEVGVPMDLPAIQAGVSRLIRTARPIVKLAGARAAPFRDLQDAVYWQLPIACLNAHMALVLIRAGLPDHAVTLAALNLCRHRFQPGRGFGCFVVDDSLLPACVMTVPKVLKAFLALPPELRTPADRSLIDDMVAVLKQFRLYRYVPEETGAWREWAGSATPAERKTEKPRWIAAGRLEPRKEKEGWLRFSFPHSYNSDLLEVLLLLGEAGVECDGVMEEGLDALLARRSRDGTWKMVGGLNGKMHADLDRKGKPSPWITYRALLAFKRFGRLNLPGPRTGPEDVRRKTPSGTGRSAPASG